MQPFVLWSTFNRIRTRSCLQMRRLPLYQKRELGWGVSRQRPRKMAQCGVKNKWGHVSISLQYNRTPQMESQGLRPDKVSGVAFRASSV
ncbi:hypothetical protein MHYP_G00248600 [Metynnis hypsauchen]